MIVVLLYCLFLFFLIYPFGIILKKIANIHSDQLLLTPVLGLIFLAVVFTSIAIFIPLNGLVFLSVCIIATFVYAKFFRQISLEFIDIKNSFYSLSLTDKIIGLILILLTGLKASSLPFLIDNESYYLQTIKWINEFGLVKGLANLHVFFAQTSSWHILQAGLNLSFISNRINDINAFVFLLISFYFLFYKDDKNWVKYIVLFTILFFQFIDSPSPDLPIYLISLICFHLFLADNKDFNNYKLMVIFLGFMVFIKLTIFPLLALLLFVLKTKKQYLFTIVVGLLFFIPWIVKNVIISGMPFYPLSFLRLNVDWVLSEEMRSFIDQGTRQTGYFESIVGKDVSLFEKLKNWFDLSGINSIFNKGILLLFLLVIFTKSFKNKRFKLLYGVMLLHFILLLFTSPQFRFFLPEFIFFSVIIVSEVSQKLPVRLVNIGRVGAVAIGVILIVNLNFTRLTSNEYHQKSDSFSVFQLVIPKSNTKYPDLKFDIHKIGNLEYYSPSDDYFLFGTSDGPLPTVNKSYINYFKKKYGVYPQQRSQNLQDGFYYERVVSED